MNPEYFGYIGCFFIGISFFPQTYKLINNKNFENISIFMILSIKIASIMMIIYAIKLKLYPVLICNISVLLNQVIILSFYCKKKVLKKYEDITSILVSL